MNPRVPCELVANLLVSAERTLGTAGLTFPRDVPVFVCFNALELSRHICVFQCSTVFPTCIRIYVSQFSRIFQAYLCVPML